MKNTAVKSKMPIVQGAVRETLKKKIDKPSATKAKATELIAKLKPIVPRAPRAKAKSVVKEEVLVAPTPIPTPAKVVEMKRVTIGDLVKIHKMTPTISLYVRLSSRIIPRQVDSRGYTTRNEYKFQCDDIVITSIRDYMPEIYVTMTPVDGDPVNMPLPATFEVILLEGEELEKVKVYAEKARLRNVHLHLHHPWQIGSVPELFVKNSKDEIIPSALFLSDKKSPMMTSTFPGYGGHGNTPMYPNGFHSRITTQTMGCLGYHMDAIAAGVRGVYDAARAKFPDAVLSNKSVMEIPADMLREAPNNFVEFGCTPVHNAYGIKADIPPCREVPFRAAAGNIHMGWGVLSKEQATPIVKALDAICGIACVSLFAGYDVPARRQYFGLPGEYRLPRHGLEYRALSNAMLIHPMITNLVIDFARKCAMVGKNGFLKDWQATEEEVISCMMECDVKKAHDIMDRNKDMMLGIIRAAYPWARDSVAGDGVGKKSAEFLFTVYKNGIDSVVADPNDFVKNWGLNNAWQAHGRGTDRNVANNYMALMNDPKRRI